MSLQDSVNRLFRNQHRPNFNIYTNNNNTKKGGWTFQALSIQRIRKTRGTQIYMEYRKWNKMSLIQNAILCTQRLIKFL